MRQEVAIFRQALPISHGILSDNCYFSAKVIRNLIFPLNFPKTGVLDANLCIFGPKLSDEKIFCQPKV